MLPAVKAITWLTSGFNFSISINDFNDGCKVYLTQFKGTTKIPYNYDFNFAAGLHGRTFEYKCTFIYYQNKPDLKNRPKGRRSKCNA